MSDTNNIEILLAGPMCGDIQPMQVRATQINADAMFKHEVQHLGKTPEQAAAQVKSVHGVMPTHYKPENRVSTAPTATATKQQIQEKVA